MIGVDQTVFGDGTGNCFSACVATLLELKIEDVPNFCGEYKEQWYPKFIEWLKDFYMAPLTQEFPGDPEPFMQWAGKCARYIPWIAGGPTDRGLHCCVYVGTNLFHDPNPNHGRKGIDAVESATFLLCERLGRR